MQRLNFVAKLCSSQKKFEIEGKHSSLISNAQFTWLTKTPALETINPQ